MYMFTQQMMLVAYWSPGTSWTSQCILFNRPQHAFRVALQCLTIWFSRTDCLWPLCGERDYRSCQLYHSP